MNHIMVSKMVTLNVQTSYARKLYYWLGFPVDGPANGPAPMPWDVMVKIPPMFQDSTCEVEVPHTASVKVVRN